VFGIVHREKIITKQEELIKCLVRINNLILKTRINLIFQIKNEYNLFKKIKLLFRSKIVMTVTKR